jgi:hypothetical protein
MIEMKVGQLVTSLDHNDIGLIIAVCDISPDVCPRLVEVLFSCGDVIRCWGDELTLGAER